jgi:hypothetical protein
VYRKMESENMDISHKLLSDGGDNTVMGIQNGRNGCSTWQCFHICCECLKPRPARIGLMYRS